MADLQIHANCECSFMKFKNCVRGQIRQNKDVGVFWHHMHLHGFGGLLCSSQSLKVRQLQLFGVLDYVW